MDFPFACQIVKTKLVFRKKLRMINPEEYLRT